MPQGPPQPGTVKRRRSPLLIGIAIGLILALLASVNNMASVFGYSELMNSGGGNALVFRGLLNNLTMQFITGWVLWTIVVGSLVWLWRKSKVAVLVLLGMLLIGAALVLLGGGPFAPSQASETALKTVYPVQTPVAQQAPTKTEPPLRMATPTTAPNPGTAAECQCEGLTQGDVDALPLGESICVGGHVVKSFCQGGVLSSTVTWTCLLFIGEDELRIYVRAKSKSDIEFIDKAGGFTPSRKMDLYIDASGVISDLAVVKENTSWRISDEQGVLVSDPGDIAVCPAAN